MRGSRAGTPLHAAVAAVFFAFGVGVGLWGGASGAILTRSGVDAATFGIILTVYTGAYLVAMSAGGALAHRFGVERALSGQRDRLWRGLVRGPQRGERGLGGQRPYRGGIPRRRRRRHHERRGRADRTAARPPDPCPVACGRVGRHGARRDSRQFDRRRPDAVGCRRSRRARARRRRRRLRSGGGRRDPSRSVGGRRRRGGKGLSFAPALLGLGVVVGVSIAAELAASVWSTLLLREEAPKLAAISGPRRGVLFRLPGGAAVQRRRDSGSGQRPSHHRRLVRDRRRRLRSRQRSGGVCGERHRLRVDRRRHRPDRSVRVRAGRAPVGGRPGGRARSASLFSALSRLPAPLATGAIAQMLSLPTAFAAFALALATTAAAAGASLPRAGRAFAAQGLKGGLGKWAERVVAGSGPGRRASQVWALPWRSRYCRASAHGWRSRMVPTDAGSR